MGQKHVNPFAGPACKISGLKSARIHGDGKLYFMDLLPVQCILVEILSHPHSLGKEGINKLKFCAFFMVRFPNDDPACSAVKGLN